MRLRSRIIEELRARLSATLPDAMRTAWGGDAVVCAIETLKFTPSSGNRDDFEAMLDFNGVVRAELRADDVDALELEPLLASLIGEPIHLNPDPATVVGGLSERARVTLIEMRDTIRDASVVSGLRFGVVGCVVGRVDPAAPIPAGGPTVRGL